MNDLPGVGGVGLLNKMMVVSLEHPEESVTVTV